MYKVVTHPRLYFPLPSEWTKKQNYRYSPWAPPPLRYEYEIGTWETCSIGQFLVFDSYRSAKHCLLLAHLFVVPHLEVWKIEVSGPITEIRLLPRLFSSPSWDWPKNSYSMEEEARVFWRGFVKNNLHSSQQKMVTPAGTCGVKELKLVRRVDNK